MYSYSVRNSEAHLIQGAESNPPLTSPPLESFHTMYNKGGPEFVVEQGMYYPIATNYGYISTGFELPGYGDDHHVFFGLDGQEVQYSGAQTESLPYVYYSPSYGYTEPPYNPYNPYIPGALLGVNDAFTGRQQYYTIPSYKTPMSSPAGYPTVFQYGHEIISSNGAESFLDAGSFSSNRVGGSGVENNFPSSPATLLTVPRSASNQTGSIATASAGSKTNAGPSKLPAAPGNSGNFCSLASPYALQASVENIRSKFYYGRVSNDVNGSSDGLTEQNRGPRSNQCKTHLAVKAYTSRGGESYAQGNTSIYPDQYNMDDFPVDYGNAKFFVIKSYSEDDVHKGIKYSVWSSTPNGNKKLQSAYEDARRIASVETRVCPIFMFFSVNASGQFCGVAEMTGPVDFHMDMDFWQQDKWSGSFPVKWHFIKDVPNPNFRHIILENKENKPVTYSRDTQEIRYNQGLEMLKIFKNYQWKTCLLDDFMYYENRQKIMQEERTGLRYRSSTLIPPLDPPRKHNFLFEQKTTKPRELVSIAKPIVDDASSTLTINPKKSVSKIDDIVTVGSMPVRVYSNGVLAAGTIQIDHPKSR